METLDVDHLVVGAGAMGMAFADALLDHSDRRVAIVDRRHAAGGHWLEAYPFVRLHQASTFYGVASTVLADGRVQESGPEAGLHVRASQPEIVGYYAAALDRMRQTGRVEVLTGSDYLGDRTVVSRVSGRRLRVPDRCRMSSSLVGPPRVQRCFHQIEGGPQSLEIEGRQFARRGDGRGVTKGRLEV
jgi:hypothetical protein